MCFTKNNKIVIEGHSNFESTCVFLTNLNLGTTLARGGDRGGQKSKQGASTACLLEKTFFRIGFNLLSGALAFPLLTRPWQRASKEQARLACLRDTCPKSRPWLLFSPASFFPVDLCDPLWWTSVWASGPLWTHRTRGSQDCFCVPRCFCSRWFFQDASPTPGRVL